MTEFALRVVGVAGAHRDVLLDAPPGAAIADVSVALAADFGGRVRSLFLGPDRLDPATPLSDAGIGDGDIVGWGRPAPSSPAGSVVLRVTGGPDRGRSFVVGSSVLVGRGGGADIALRDPSVSRCHAVVAANGDGVEIRDLGGKNGVRLDGQRVMTGRLGIGEEMQIGATMLRVERPAPHPPLARWDGRGGVELVVGTRSDGTIVDVTLDAGCGELVIAGGRPAALSLARSVVVQLMAPCPARAQLFLLAPRDSGAWRWLLWLPQVRRSAGQPWRVASRLGHVEARLAELDDELRRRELAVDDPAPDPIVVIVDGFEATALPERLRTAGPRHAIYTLTVTESVEPAAPARRHVLTVSRDEVCVGDDDATRATALGCRVDTADTIARARVRQEADCRDAVPGFSQLFARSDGARGWNLPIGFDEAAKPTRVDLAAGPILIAREADDDPTEILRTLVAAAASTYPPDRLRVVVVDSRGQLTDLELLPHCDWRAGRLDRAVIHAAAAVASRCRVLVVIDDIDDVHASDPRLVDALAGLAADPNVTLVAAMVTAVNMPTALIERCGARIGAARGQDPARPHDLYRNGEVTKVRMPLMPPASARAGSRAAVPRITRLDISALGKARARLAHHRGSVADVAAALSAAEPARGGQPHARGASVVRVLLVEDHAVLAEGMRMALERGGCSVTAVSADADGALVAVSASRIDVAVVDIDLSGGGHTMPGADAVDALRDAVPDLPLVVVTRHGRPSAAVTRRVSARYPEAFLPPGSDGAALTDAVLAVARGHAAGGAAFRTSGGRAFDNLTSAEQRVVVELARQPDTRARLARRLHLSISTVDSHLRAIKQKVGDELAADGLLPADGVVSTEALIGWALEHGYNRLPASAAAVRR